MVNNQGELSKIILEDQYYNGNLIQDILIFRIKFQNKEILIKVYEKWMNFKEFRETSEETDDCVKFDYFINFVNLLADLCLNRNYIAIGNKKKFNLNKILLKLKIIINIFYFFDSTIRKNLSFRTMF